MLEKYHSVIVEESEIRSGQELLQRELAKSNYFLAAMALLVAIVSIVISLRVQTPPESNNLQPTESKQELQSELKNIRAVKGLTKMGSSEKARMSEVPAWHK